MANRLLPAIQQVFSNIGEIGIGFKLETYQTLTTTPLATYSDEALTIPNANPASGATTGNQIADGNGRFGDIWVDALSNYKIILTDADDVILDTFDPVDGTEANTLTAFDPMPEAFWGTTAGTSSIYTLDSNVDISSIGYKSTQIFQLQFHTPCTPSPTLSIDGLISLNLKKYSGVGTKVDLEADDVNSQTYIVRNDGTDFVVLNPNKPEINLSSADSATTTERGVVFLISTINLSNNVGDSDHSIDFTVGSFQFDDGSGQDISTALTKQIDANWVAGDSVGGLDIGTVSNNTTYHCFAIYDSTNAVSDYLFSLSLSSPTLPGTYDKKKRVGSVITDGSANIRQFIQTGNYFMYKSPTLDIDITTVNVTAVVSAVRTPTGIKTRALLNAWIVENTSVAGVYISDPDVTDLLPADTAAPLFSLFASDASGSADDGHQVDVFTNTSSQIRIRGDKQINNFRVATLGWIDILL